MTERQLPEKGNLIPWQKVFEELHADAAAKLPVGARYEIRAMSQTTYTTAIDGNAQYQRGEFRSIGWVSDLDMNRVEPWTDTPKQTETHYRVGRYTVPEG